jgi:hypothetical protein
MTNAGLILRRAAIAPSGGSSSGGQVSGKSRGMAAPSVGRSYGPSIHKAMASDEPRHRRASSAGVDSRVRSMRWPLVLVDRHTPGSTDSSSPGHGCLGRSASPMRHAFARLPAGSPGSECGQIGEHGEVGGHSKARETSCSLARAVGQRQPELIARRHAAGPDPAAGRTGAGTLPQPSTVTRAGRRSIAISITGAVGQGRGRPHLPASRAGADRGRPISSARSTASASVSPRLPLHAGGGAGAVGVQHAIGIGQRHGSIDQDRHQVGFRRRGRQRRLPSGIILAVGSGSARTGSGQRPGVLAGGEADTSAQSRAGGNVGAVSVALARGRPWRPSTYAQGIAPRALRKKRQFRTGSTPCSSPASTRSPSSMRKARHRRQPVAKDAARPAAGLRPRASAARDPAPSHLRRRPEPAARWPAVPQPAPAPAAG